jgi:hypothetical protein
MPCGPLKPGAVGESVDPRHRSRLNHNRLTVTLKRDRKARLSRKVTSVLTGCTVANLLSGDRHPPARVRLSAGRLPLDDRPLRLSERLADDHRQHSTHDITRTLLVNLRHCRLLGDTVTNLGAD